MCTNICMYVQQNSSISKWSTIPSNKKYWNKISMMLLQHTLCGKITALALIKIIATHQNFLNHSSLASLLYFFKFLLYFQNWYWTIEVYNFLPIILVHWQLVIDMEIHSITSFIHAFLIHFFLLQSWKRCNCFLKFIRFLCSLFGFVITLLK